VSAAVWHSSTTTVPKLCAETVCLMHGVCLAACNTFRHCCHTAAQVLSLGSYAAEQHAAASAFVVTCTISPPAQAAAAAGRSVSSCAQQLTSEKPSTGFLTRCNHIWRDTIAVKALFTCWLKRAVLSLCWGKFDAADIHQAEVPVWLGGRE
jgi:hypothetical protein